MASLSGKNTFALGITLGILPFLWTLPATAQNAAAETHPQSSPKETTLPTLAFVFKVGFTVTGFGTDSSTCSGSDCREAQESNFGYRHQPNPYVSTDLLWQLTPWLRTGPNVAFSLPGKVKFDSPASTLDFGSVLTADWALEFTPQVGKSTWILPRIQTGYSMLDPTGSMKSKLTRFQSDCEKSSANFDGCSSASGIHSGANVGVGVGVLFATGGQIRFRVDTMTEFYWFKIASITAKSASTKLDESLTGARFLLNFGMEI
jgi:hypothetical protein